jgi:two-component system chemotaxis response regulator CheB
MGVVLSGLLDDGTAGLLAVKTQGGLALVQHPDDALFPGMPLSALENVEVDHSVSASELGPLLETLAQEPVEGGATPVPRHLERESKIAELGPTDLEGEEPPGTPSGFSCPECGGPLNELQDGEMSRFRCHVGRAYSPDSLLAEQADSLEAALWVALRTLEENARLADRLAVRSHERGHSKAAAHFEERRSDARERAALIRHVLLGKAHGGQPAASESASEPSGSVTLGSRADG